MDFTISFNTVMGGCIAGGLMIASYFVKKYYNITIKSIELQSIKLDSIVYAMSRVNDGLGTTFAKEYEKKFDELMEEKNFINS